MRLNHNCVRDIMLFMEENVKYNQYVDFSQVKIGSYSQEDLVYAADKLLEAGYLDGSKHTYSGRPFPDIRVTSITWSGHQFLDNIRDDGVWENTKHVISKFSSVSLNLISNIASQVITSLIHNQLDLR